MAMMVRMVRMVRMVMILELVQVDLDLDLGPRDLNVRTRCEHHSRKCFCSGAVRGREIFKNAKLLLNGWRFGGCKFYPLKFEKFFQCVYVEPHGRRHEYH